MKTKLLNNRDVAMRAVLSSKSAVKELRLYSRKLILVQAEYSSAFVLFTEDRRERKFKTHQIVFLDVATKRLLQKICIIYYYGSDNFYLYFSESFIVD
jgi:hypothetical protein